ncbi:MAG TPA: LytR C-terminal domain-containing protein, partial [Acidimicrobiales bacterium]|nr:LytR C-terminal domain-containing protein [Acidimicrobiales bacterium]
VDVSNLGTTTTAATEDTTTTAATSDHSPSEVSVLVLNGSSQAGVAASTSTTIGESGYTMLSPSNAPANVDTTAVYYAEGYEADAIAVAQILGKGTDAVKPLTEASLGGAEGDADVVVVLGADTPPASGGDSSSGTTTSTTSAG